MSGLAVVLPVATFLALWALLIGLGPQDREPEWRSAFLRAAVVWGALAAVSAEVLSLFAAVRQGWLAAFWGLVLVLLFAYSVRRGLFRAAWMHLRGLKPGFSVGERLILVGIMGVVLLLLLIAWVSPPNNYDSYLYHMARVVHWAQAGSLDHFPSGFEHQLTKPTWAETAILHLRVLWGNDKPANLVQWFSMLGSLIGVSAITGLLGGTRKAQILAATVALSIPMGILQATSTQNDYVVAFWMVCLAYLVVRHRRQQASPGDVGYVALATGLGMLTKGTGYVYAVPLLAWYFWPRRPWPWMTWVRDASVVAVLVVLLNLGFWWRNVVTFGGPFGTSEWLSANLTLGPVLIPTQSAGGEPTPTESAQPTPTESAQPTPTESAQPTPTESAQPTPTESAQPTPTESAQPTPAAPAIADAAGEGGPGGPSFVLGLVEKALGVPKGVAQITAFQLVTPFGRVQRVQMGVLEAFPAIFDTTWMERIRLSWNHEDLAPSPVHMVLAGIAIIGVWLLRPRSRWGAVRAYAAMLGAAYLLLPVVIGHGASLWGIRYVLPFFVLSAPLAAVALAGAAREKWALAGAGVFVVLALPWTLLNNVRPLIGATPRVTRIESILTTDRTEVLLANGLQSIQNEYAEAAAETFVQGCGTVGLIGMLDTHPEYPFWWILDAPQSGIRIESLSHSVHTERYVDRTFKPCLIICAGCDASVSVPEYSLVRVHGPFSVWGLE
jgi:hypothetical protein